MTSIVDRLMPNKLSELFDEHIKPHHRVLCVGAFQQPTNDPSAFYASTRAAQVHILDAQSPFLIEQLEKKKANHTATQKDLALFDRLTWLEKQARGHGDPVSYRNIMKKLKEKYAIKARTPKIQFRDVTNTRFRYKQFDVLIDAGSLYWILEGKVHGAEKHQGEPEALQKVLEEYARVSRKAVFLKPATDAGISSLKRELKAMGAKLTEKNVSNIYCVHSKKGIVTMRHFYPYGYALVAEFEEKKRQAK